MPFWPEKIAPIVLALAWGAALLQPAAGLAQSPAGEDRPRTLTLYTALTATTPQLALWAAIRQGWPEGYQWRVEYWKSLDDLRGLVLAGRGDLWLGSLDGFARAAARGAPVSLVAVTGWKKFYFVAAPDGPEPKRPAGLEELARTLAEKGRPLGVAPRNSPALGLLAEMARRGGPAFTPEPLEAGQLMLEIGRGDRNCGLLPEPLVSALLIKNPNLKIVAGLEEDFARRFGGPDGLPLVGLAVNQRLIEERPELVRSLTPALEAGAAALAGRTGPDLAALLPEEVIEALGSEVLVRSLKHDLQRLRPAAGISPEISAYLRLAAPDLYEGRSPDWQPSPNFIYRPAP
ncbi:MAG: hypothetical protein LBP33_04145 [Candidatus Adiutrix sp.]|nr:hypothetical protein [Candidatus Adiutrix sp.]